MKVKKVSLYVIALFAAFMTACLSMVPFTKTEKASADSALAEEIGFTDEEISEFAIKCFGDINRNQQGCYNALLFVDHSLSVELHDCATIQEVGEVATVSAFWGPVLNNFNTSWQMGSNAPYNANNPFYERSWLFIGWGFENLYLGISGDVYDWFDFSDETLRNTLMSCSNPIYGMSCGLPDSDMYSLFLNLQGIRTQAPPPVYILTDEPLIPTPDGLYVIYFNTEYMELCYDCWYTDYED